MTGKKMLIASLLCSGIALLLFWGFVQMVQPFEHFVTYAKTVSPVLVDATRLEAHVKKLSIDFHPRTFDNIGNLNRTAAYIQQEFTRAGGNVSEQSYDVRGRTYKNIRVRFESLSTPLLVIGAHYDSHGITPGADDNASGIAGLIELAHFLGKNPPQRAVELVAYTLEEPPYFRTEYMGSAIHAQSLKANNQAVDMMISLEMIGYFKDEHGSQTYPLPFMDLWYPKQGNYISVIARPNDQVTVKTVKTAYLKSTDLPVYSINAPRWIHGIDFSDHLNYWDLGYSAVMITDTSFNRNKNYHTSQDTYEKLDYQRMAKVVHGVIALTQKPLPKLP